MRRKKSKPIQYIKAGISDNLIRISWRTKTELKDLRILNPDIKSAGGQLMLGRKVRIS